MLSCVQKNDEDSDQMFDWNSISGAAGRAVEWPLQGPCSGPLAVMVLAINGRMIQWALDRTVG